MWDKQDFLPLTYEKGGLVPSSFSQVPGERIILLEASRALCPSHPYGGSAELLKGPPRTSTPLNVPMTGLTLRIGLLSFPLPPRIQRPPLYRPWYTGWVRTRLPHPGSSA